MLGDDPRTPDVTILVLEANTDGRSLRLTADHGAVGIAVDDGVADNVGAHALELVEDGAKIIECDLLLHHQHVELFDRDVRRLHLDQRRGRINDVAGRKDHLAAIAFQDADFVLRLRMDGIVLAVLIALGKIIRLNRRNVAERRRVGIDDDEIDHFQRGEI